MSALDKHEYRPLEDPASQIRLLEIFPEGNGGNEPLEWKLSTFKFDQAPPYHAISYTWGPEQPTEDIPLDTEWKCVRKNCADVLRLIARFRMCRYYWPDALCINQTDTQKKSGQVALMGDIFRKAEHVLICLGEQDDDGEYALQVISRQTYTSVKPRMFIFDSAVFGRDGISLDVDVGRFGHSLSLLSQRPYFKRVWVVQELFFAREASICCGSTKIPAHHLLQEFIAVDRCLMDVEDQGNIDEAFKDRLPPASASSQLELLNATFKQMDQEFNTKCTDLLLRYDAYNASPEERRRRIETIVQLRYGLECQDPRDKVYGALALIDWEGLAPVTPDYAKSPYDLAKEMHLDRLPASTAWQLIVHLAIDVQSPEIIEGLHLRQRNLMSRTIKSAFTTTRTNRIEQSCQGYQLTRINHSLSTTARQIDPTQTTDPNFNRPNTRAELLPGGTKSGDWFLDFTDHSIIGSRHRRDYIVVRQRGDVFGFVGRAVCSTSFHRRLISDASDISDFEGVSPRERRFVLWFDPDDFLVLAATVYPALDAETIVRTRICSSPISSFAELQQEVSEAVLDGVG